MCERSRKRTAAPETHQRLAPVREKRTRPIHPPPTRRRAKRRARLKSIFSWSTPSKAYFARPSRDLVSRERSSVSPHDTGRTAEDLSNLANSQKNSCLSPRDLPRTRESRHRPRRGPPRFAATAYRHRSRSAAFAVPLSPRLSDDRRRDSRRLREATAARQGLVPHVPAAPRFAHRDRPRLRLLFLVRLLTLLQATIQRVAQRVRSQSLARGSSFTRSQRSLNLVVESLRRRKVAFIYYE